MIKRKLMRIKNFIRAYKKKTDARGLVLLYHRVRPYKKDRSSLTVTPERFKEQLIHLKENYECLSCHAFYEQLKNKKLKSNSMLITFDDGYVDNYQWAFPIIEELKIPVTFFIATGNIDTKNYFWWDEVEVLFDKYFENHNELVLHQLNQAQFAIRSQADIDNVFERVHLLLKPLTEAKRQTVIEELYKLCKLEKLQTEDHRSLTTNELQKMANSSYITIGAHTVNHIVLSSDNLEIQKEQIQESKTFLEKTIGKAVEYFAYPFGAIEDYNENTKQLCKELGFKATFANHYDVITFDADHFAIPRALVRDWELNNFKERLAEYSLQLMPGVSQRIKAKMTTSAFESRAKKWPSVKALESEMKPRSVSLVNTFDTNGGASLLAFRIADHLKNKFDINYYVSRKFSDKPWIKELPKTFNENEQLFLSYQDSNGLLDLGNRTAESLFTDKHFSESHIVHMHNLHGGYFDIRYLNYLKDKKRKVIWTLHDMEAITGHCAHSFECDRWETGCVTCPHLEYYPSIRVDTAKDYLKLKKEIFSDFDLDIVVPSDWLRKKLLKSFLKDKKIHLIYNGVDSKVFYPLDKISSRQKLNLPLDKKLVLFCAHGGVSNFYKGGEFALRLAKKFPNIVFVNIGGEDQHDLANWIDVPYVKAEEEMNQYYNAADVLFYPSRADNCPLVLLEAKMAGLPCFGSLTGGIPELIEDYEDGVLFDLKHFEAFEIKFDSLISNKELMDMFSKKSRINALEKFNISYMISEYEKIYQS